jgi:hypothetical protein
MVVIERYIAKKHREPIRRLLEKIGCAADNGTGLSNR